VRIDAILPAGGRIGSEFAAQAGAHVKALIPLDGKTVLERTIEALRATGCVERIVVIGPEEIAEHPASKEADAVLPEGGNSGPANIIRGLQWLHEADGQHAERVMVVTTDLPFLTPQGIVAFLDSCDPNADICAPLVSKETFESRYPGSGNEYVSLADGRWTMGCVFLVDPEAILRNRLLIERVFSVRKSQLGMARLLGLGFILRFATGRLAITHIEERCGALLGCSSRAIRDSAPELAYDIDTPEEWRYAAGTVGD